MSACGLRYSHQCTLRIISLLSFCNETIGCVTAEVIAPISLTWINSIEQWECTRHKPLMAISALIYLIAIMFIEQYMLPLYLNQARMYYVCMCSYTYTYVRMYVYIYMYVCIQYVCIVYKLWICSYVYICYVRTSFIDR